MSINQTSSLKVALVGAGQIVQNYHVPALLGLGHRIIYAYDPSARALSDLNAGLITPVAISSDDRLQIPAEADCVLIASPSALHAAQVQSILETDHAVFCEKPLACRAHEASALAELAERKSKVLQVGYFRRHYPALIQLKDWLRSGIYGNVKKISIRGGHIAKGIPESFLNLKLSGGGVLMDFGVHALDLLLNWCDHLEIKSYVDDAYLGGVEANCAVSLTAEIGTQKFPVLIELSRTSPIGYSVTLDFEQASISADLNSGHELTLTQRNKLPLRILVSDSYDTVYYFAEEWREFSARLRGAAEKIQCLRHAVLTTEFAEQCYRQKQFFSLPWRD